jgi:uncharacterized protein YciI
MRSKLPFLASLCLGLCAGGAAAQPPAIPAFPPDVAARIPPNLRGYFIAFLVDPPAGAQRTLPHDVFLAHLDYLRRQVEAGVYQLAGPLTDQNRIRGVIILSAGSIEQARTIVAADPAVLSGGFEVELHAILLPSLASLRIEYPRAAH